MSKKKRRAAFACGDASTSDDSNCRDRSNTSGSSEYATETDNSGAVQDNEEKSEDVSSPENDGDGASYERSETSSGHED